MVKLGKALRVLAMLRLQAAAALLLRCYCLLLRLRPSTMMIPMQTYQPKEGDTRAGTTVAP